MYFKPLLASALLACSLSANAMPFSFAGPSATGVDASAPGTDISFTVSDFGIINDLNLFLEYQANTDPLAASTADLTVSLSHLGTTIVLSNATSFASPVTFDDEGFTPASPLSAFDGLDVNGLWTLNVTDTGFSTGSDTVIAWNINGDLSAVSSVPTPSILWLLGTAGLGFLGLRKKANS